MDYQISEEEFSRLESARDQLGLIYGLLATAREGEEMSCVKASQLLAFVDAQQGTLAQVVKAANEREAQALKARHEEAAAPKAPQVFIAPELLMGLMDAACGELTDSEALNKLWDGLYGAGTLHRPYMDALHRFIDVMRARGLVVHVQSLDGHRSLAFVPAQQEQPKNVFTIF
ncbi:hypothetical protein [Paracidovorax anthurii]|uniref:Uncharacterized protein n=1 Tax=Paracidovorax anthurii TaxID=78229 RepID=A0A328ZF55_9BURK|nr:hypothetical protein [Paracidovorax anthurii]RAR83955.1 hypothetical protein AX018_1013104 [Paracidovorax anthurii]